MHHTLHLVIRYSWWTIAVLWLIAAFTSKRSVQVQSVGSRAVQVILTLAAFLLVFDADTAIGPLAYQILPQSLTSSIVGAILTVAGILFAIGARLYLGRNWSGTVSVKENHELIRSGPYAIVRHPIYTGLLIALAGSAIELGQVRGALGVVVALIGFKLKSQTEEFFMQQQFGAEYGRYKGSVRGIIPFVW